MKKNIIFTALRYVRLRDERDQLLILSNLIISACFAILIAFPFIFFSTSNFFHKDGFVDKFGSFSSVLTGFYVAGLLAVATFSDKMGNLDGPIEVGRILLRDRADGDPVRYLTRREYVCAIFGYLSFLSLFLTVISIIAVIIADAAPPLKDVFLDMRGRHIILEKDLFRAGFIIAFSTFASHLAIVTCYGLYYLMDRIYAKKPVLLPARDGDD